jgi:two-component system response regulator AgrA
MIPIRIWDDNPEIVEIVRDAVQKRIEIDELEMEIVAADTDEKAVLASLSETKQSGVYFFDIQGPEGEQQGFLMAQKVRQIDPLAKLIFVTTHEEFLPITFERKLEAFDFIIKDQGVTELRKKVQDTLISALESIKSRAQIDQAMLSFRVGGRFLQVPMREVYYLEALGNHHLCLVTKERWFEIVGELQQFLERYPELTRINKSEIANLKNATSFDKKQRQLYFEGNQIVADVSYRKVRDVQAYFEKKS